MRKTISRMASRGAMALFMVLATGAAALAQMANPTSVVKPQAYVSLDPVPRGQTLDAAVVVEIANGFHMNSHKPSEDYLIPTAVTVDPPPGVRVVETTYPAGQEKKFSFSPDKPLNVYTGKVTLRMKIAVSERAPLGTMSIPTTLRYQACNDTACLPPVKVPLILRIDVAEEGTTAQRQHTDIFQPTAAHH